MLSSELLRIFFFGAWYEQHKSKVGRPKENTRPLWAKLRNFRWTCVDQKRSHICILSGGLVKLKTRRLCQKNMVFNELISPQTRCVCYKRYSRCGYTYSSRLSMAQTKLKNILFQKKIVREITLWKFSVEQLISPVHLPKKTLTFILYFGPNVS